MIAGNPKTKHCQCLRHPLQSHCVKAWLALAKGRRGHLSLQPLGFADWQPLLAPWHGRSCVVFLALAMDHHWTPTGLPPGSGSRRRSVGSEVSMVDLWTTNFGQPSPDLSPQDHLELRSGFRLSYAVAGPKLPHYLKKFLLLAIWSVHGLLRSSNTSAF